MKKLIKYLNEKDKSQYSILDFIFEKYLNGEVDTLLKNCGFLDIDIFVRIGKKSKILQLSFSYYNLGINVDFEENGYTFCVHQSNDSPDTVEKQIVQHGYEDNFSIEAFTKNLLQKLDSDPRLSKEKILRKSKRIDKFGILKVGIIFATILVYLILIIYVAVSKSPIKLGIWGYIGLFIIIMVCLILHCLQKRK